MLAAASPGFAAERYARASVDSAGQVRIVTRDGRAIVPVKRPDQVEFARVAISPDGRRVGWLALYPNCCTSYPIPLELVVYTNGKVHIFRGSEQAVWRWCFMAGSKQVAFEQETVHGGFGVHYELRDVASGRLIAEFDPEVGPDQQVLANQKVPGWVAELDAMREEASGDPE